VRKSDPALLDRAPSRLSNEISTPSFRYNLYQVISGSSMPHSRCMNVEHAVRHTIRAARTAFDPLTYLAW
jgi:hypothetical protein